MLAHGSLGGFPHRRCLGSPAHGLGRPHPARRRPSPPPGFVQVTLPVDLLDPGDRKSAVTRRWLRRLVEASAARVKIACFHGRPSDARRSLSGRGRGGKAASLVSNCFSERSLSRNCWRKGWEPNSIPYWCMPVLRRASKSLRIIGFWCGFFRSRLRTCAAEPYNPCHLLGQMIGH